MKLADKPFYPLWKGDMNNRNTNEGATVLERLVVALSQNSNMIEKPYYNKKDGTPIYEQNAIRIINQAEFLLAELDRRNANK